MAYTPFDNAIFKASPPILNDGDVTPLLVDSSGNLKVNVVVGGGGGASSAYGPDNAGSPSTKPPIQLGALDSSNLVQYLTETAGALDVNIKSGLSNPLPVSAASLPLPTGAATSANQATEITSLSAIAASAASIDGKTPASPATSAKQDTGNTSLANIDTGIGTDGAGESPANGTGVRGWLRGVYDKLAGILAANISQWGGAVVSPATNTSTDGSDTAPIVRTIGRKFQRVLTTTPLGSGATFISPWIDTQQSGTNMVQIEWRADQTSGNAGVLIEGTEDTSDSTFTFTLQQINGVAALNSTYVMAAFIPCRYWRVRYVNGAVAQTSFKLSSTSTNISGLSVGLSQYGGGFASYAPKPMLVDSSGNLSLLGGQTLDIGTTRSFISGGVASGTIAPVANFYALTNGAGVNAWQGARTPAIFKTASATASGNTAVWTPTTGKKFRLMRFQIEVTDNATLASAGVITIKFQDSDTNFGFAFDVHIPATALSNAIGGYKTGWIDLGNGYLSALANNVLNVNVSIALVTGNVRVNVCGTEE